jgi:hypothetical protein
MIVDVGIRDLGAAEALRSAIRVLGRHPAAAAPHFVFPSRENPIAPPLRIGLRRDIGLAGDLSPLPAPVQFLGHAAELDNQVAGQILGLDLAAFLAPEAE